MREDLVHFGERGLCRVGSTTNVLLFPSGPSTVLAYFRSSSRICVCSGKACRRSAGTSGKSGCLVRDVSLSGGEVPPGDDDGESEERPVHERHAGQERRQRRIVAFGNRFGRVRSASNTLPTPTNIATMRTRARRSQRPTIRSRPLLASAGNASATHEGGLGPPNTTSPAAAVTSATCPDSCRRPSRTRRRQIRASKVRARPIRPNRIARRADRQNRSRHQHAPVEPARGDGCGVGTVRERVERRERTSPATDSTGPQRFSRSA